MIRSLHTSMDASDFNAIRRVAHSLKSSGAMLGANEFSELCEKLEYQNREEKGSYDTYSSLIAAIENEYQKVKEALSDIATDQF